MLNADGHSINRDKESHTTLARSLDGGETWKPVMIYYFSTAEKPEQHIAATIWQLPPTR